MKNARSRYFTGRSFAGEIEPPVYKVLGQELYFLRKSIIHVMLALRDLIGEDQVNLVLKTITDRHRYRNSNKLEANTIEFLDEIYKVTPTHQHTFN